MNMNQGKPADDGGFDVGDPIANQLCAADVRGLGCSDADQMRRLLAIAAVYDGMSRAEAATIGSMGRQNLRLLEPVAEPAAAPRAALDNGCIITLGSDPRNYSNESSDGNLVEFR